MKIKLELNLKKEKRRNQSWLLKYLDGEINNKMLVNLGVFTLFKVLKKRCIVKILTEYYQYLNRSRKLKD